MKILILGGKGMAGHMVTDYLSRIDRYEVSFTSRTGEGIPLDAANFDEVKGLISDKQPDVIINCIGLLNDQAAANLVEAIKVNSLLPHVLAETASLYGGKVIHISTDCVFSGEKGSYAETDLLDGTSIYAKTKALGEITHAPHLTIRTSIIGPELKESGIGLFHWFQQQTGMVNGFTNVWWNGVTTLELAKGIDHVIQKNITGLLHLTAPQPISKHDLLMLLQQSFQKNDVKIIEDGRLSIDRTLVNTRKDFDYQVPDYPEMISALANWMKQDG
ncbi:dTDP-4-dehydrorhamnose reductase family protein [Mesobacillus subterraneus]|uniref:dTDP-4-dehydrorhamnose reductase n=1 Tax=Mesobacillus subterraneus TaxID=285983 RepID=A0A0D6ZE37_9BACI|nr:SDR family oxidoreductase [Mesobacillus subterraneus]KIY23555.1 dTDP-4-dehydrorhamnose reductase [Mesobacillus subterraneus]